MEEWTLVNDQNWHLLFQLLPSQLKHWIDRWTFDDEMFQDHVEP